MRVEFSLHTKPQDGCRALEYIHAGEFHHNPIFLHKKEKYDPKRKLQLK
jgi:hypothetical protein